MIGELELREDYLSMSPFVRLSRQQMQVNENCKLHIVRFYTFYSKDIEFR